MYFNMTPRNVLNNIKHNLFNKQKIINHVELLTTRLDMMHTLMKDIQRLR